MGVRLVVEHLCKGEAAAGSITAVSANPDFDMFRTSEDHEAIREAVRAVAEAKIKPFAAEVDEESRFPSEANQALIASDFHAAHVAEEHGGAGAEIVDLACMLEEATRHMTPGPILSTALAGVLAAPVINVTPLMGSNLIIVVFAVVVVGGMGSILGAIITGYLLGIAEGLTKVFYPEASNIVIFVIMAIVLILRPAGLFGRDV